MICIHHSKDLDGWASGAIVKRKFPDCKLMGWDFKDPLPELDQFKDEIVILIDLTFPLDKMLYLGSISNLTVIDHHIGKKREIDALEKEKPGSINFKYIYKDGVAACEIGWDYFFHEKLPLCIRLISMYDTWVTKGEYDWEKVVLRFQFFARSVCYSPETFEKQWFKDYDSVSNINTFLFLGATVLRYQNIQDMIASQETSFERTLAGYNAICLNSRVFSSESIKSVYDASKHDIMVGFCCAGDKWLVSLRTEKPEIDLSEIAKKRGGGGHKAAAGFEVNSFEDIFK